MNSSRGSLRDACFKKFCRRRLRLVETINKKIAQLSTMAREARRSGQYSQNLLTKGSEFDAVALGFMLYYSRTQRNVLDNDTQVC